jgi:predicted transcriptional regulator
MERSVALLSVAKTKGLPSEKNSEVRSRLKQLIAEHFPGDQNGAADVMGVSQAYLSQFLGTDRGAGAKLLIGLERLEAYAARKRPTAGTVAQAVAPASNQHTPQPQIIPGTLPTYDPAAEDAMRWRALVEVGLRHQDVAAGFALLADMKFDGSQRAVSWGDYYSLAMSQLEELKKKPPKRRR